MNLRENNESNSSSIFKTMETGLKSFFLKLLLTDF